MSNKTLRDWAAINLKHWTSKIRDGVLGWEDSSGNWVKYEDWLPDRPESGQIWGLIDIMRDTHGFECEIRTEPILGVKNQLYVATFHKLSDGKWKGSYAKSRFPCVAILKAAMETHIGE